MLRYMFLVLSCMIIGFLSWKRFMFFIGTEEMQIIVTQPDEEINSRLFFTIALGVIPIIYAVVQYINKLKFWYRGFFTVLITLTGGLIAVAYRVAEINKIIELKLALGLDQSFQLKDLHLSMYLLFGFILGGGVSLMVFKRT